MPRKTANRTCSLNCKTSSNSDSSCYKGQWKGTTWLPKAGASSLAAGRVTTTSSGSPGHHSTRPQALPGMGTTALLGSLYHCLTSLWESNFPVTSKCKSPLSEFQIIPPCPVTIKLCKKPASILFISFVWILEDHSEVSSEPSFLQAQQAQLLHHFFIGGVLQAFDHLHGPPLDTLRQLHIVLTLRTPGLDTVLQMGPSHPCPQQRGGQPPSSPHCHPSFNAAQNTVGLWAASIHYWLMSNFSSTRNPKSSASLLSRSSSPSL